MPNDKKELPNVWFNRERDAMYEEAARVMGQEPNKPEDEKPEDKKEDPKPDAANPPADQSGGAESDTSGDEKPDDKEKDEKLVPLPALKEERERRKRLQEEMRELRRQQEMLMTDNQKLMEVLKAGSKPDDDIPSYSDPDDIVKEVIALRKKVDDQAKTINEFKGSYDADKSQKMAHDYEAMAKKAADELSAEGYPGFLDLTEAVGRDLKTAYEDTEDQSVFTPEGWKRIYKSTTYPRIFGTVIKTAVDRAKAEKVDGKKKLKEKANMSGSPGKAEGGENSPDENRPLTDKEKYDRYMAMRKTSSVFRT